MLSYSVEYRKLDPGVLKLLHGLYRQFGSGGVLNWFSGSAGVLHFDRRAFGGAPEGCARCLMCRCEHILNAKSSRDAFVAQRHEGHFCGCVMHGRATQGSCIAQDGAFDGRAVGGAPGAIFIYGAITNTL